MLLHVLIMESEASATSHTMKGSSPAKLWAQKVHIDLYLLQRLPVQRLQPYALHQSLHSYPCDACHASAALKALSENVLIISSASITS